MKKKLLSLVLAGAMVASTSVSAFAATPGHINGSDAEEHSTDVEITGQVLNNNGDLPAGTFNVTVPTTASFTVRSNGGVITVQITIQNRGTQNIDVYAEKFVDTTPEDNKEITVVEQSNLTGKNRSYVSLNIKGSDRALYLKSEKIENGTKNGIYTNSNFDTPAVGANNLKLTSIAAGRDGDITLNGTAGADTSGDQITQSVSNSFTLTLKIKKSENQSK